MNIDPKKLQFDLETLFQLKLAIERYPDANWNDALSKGQLLSKLWLIEQLKQLDIDLGTVFVLGGWVGVLPALMFHNKELRFDRIRSFDIDPKCADTADSLNRNVVIDGWRFKATTMDMFKLDYTEAQYTTLKANGDPVTLTEYPNTIINTSCDHVSPFSDWWELIPLGKLVVLQNNNFFGADEDHTNNVHSIDEMKKQAPMNDLLFEGELDLTQYKRFMLIGRK